MTATLASATFAALGTTAFLAIDDESALDEARRLLADELAAIDLACSRFRSDSELSRLNAAAGTPTRVGPLLAEAVAVALRAAAQTGGAVDPTVAPALVALGYDRDFAAVAPVGDQAVRGVRPAGWRSVRWDARSATLCLAPGAQLDLGATAKALAADRAAAAIAARTGAAVLVSLGGDIATAGSCPDGGWTVRVGDDHRAGPRAPGQSVAIRGGGLATSSTTVRRWRRGGRAINHIIDPRTGEPCAPVWRTVTVTAASCVEANTATTAAVVLGAVAPAWLASRCLPSRLVAEDGRVVTTGGWPGAE